MTDSSGPPRGSHHAGEQDALWAREVMKFRDRHAVPFDVQWSAYRKIYGDRRPEDGPPIAWHPDSTQIHHSNLGRFMNEHGYRDYQELHDWSVAHRAEFWGKVIERLGVVFSRPPGAIVDLSEGPGNPRWLPGARLNIAESCFSAPAERTAVAWSGEGLEPVHRTSYQELERLVKSLAGFVQETTPPGAAVSLYMPMTLECVAAYLGIVLAGRRVVSIADSFSAEELGKRMQIAGSELVVTSAGYLWSGRRVRPYQKVREAGVPRAIVTSDVVGREAEPLRDQDVRWETIVEAPSAFTGSSSDPDEVTNILFSSGTTGVPKAIPWTHLTPIKCAMDGHFHQDIHSSDTVAWPTNIGWMMGPWLIYAGLVNKATLALYVGAPTGAGFTRFVDEAGVSILGAVPSLVRAWRRTGATNRVDWSRLRVLSSTGEPSNREDYLWWMSVTGYRAPVIEYLGGTEIGGGHITGTVVQPASPATFTTPSLGLDFRILDEAGRPVPEGGEGELFLVPPSIGLSQKLLNQDHDGVYYAGCPRGPNGEILRRHGDRIARLPGGFFKAAGRADDAMNLRGIKVSSVELEQVIDGHPVVYESAAVAIQPEGTGTDRLVVFAVVREPRGRVELKRELDDRLASKLNPLFKLHDLVLVDALPRTPSNKIMRRALRDRYRRGFRAT